MTSQLPLALRALENLRFQIWGPQRIKRLDTFIVDLSDWKLSLSERTPCFWIHLPEHFGIAAIDLAEEIRDAVRQKAWQNVSILILVDGPGDELREHLRNASTQFAVLDDKQQKAILDAPSPTRVMLDFLLNQMSRSELSPYETSRPVTGSRFFGRKDYLSRVQNHPKTNFLVVGIRRIGKSSLLRELERILNLHDPTSENQQRRLYVDCSVIQTPEELYREILSRLSPHAVKMFLDRRSQTLRAQAKVFDYLASEHGGQITFLLDEIDTLLERTQHDQNFLHVLRSAWSEGRARFIIAGFREARRAIYDTRHPFYNFGDALPLDALQPQEAEKMIKEPLDRLRVKLEPRDEIIARIYRETAGLPNLIQFYCQTLLESLDRSPNNQISLADLQQVYDNPSFRDFVLTTFLANSRPLERAIIFAMVSPKEMRAGELFSLKEIDAELNRRKFPVRFNALDEACRNLLTGGILQKHGKRFNYSLPLLPQMLEENYQIDFVFDKARQEYETTPSTAEGMSR